MSTKHTPGPWVTGRDEKEKGGKWQVFTAAGAMKRLATLEQVGHSTEENDANARLIAAAPELVEALEALVTAYDTDEGYGDAFVARVDAARAALARAKGETP